MKKTILYLIISTSLLYSCKKSTEINNSIINPEKFIPASIKLSEFSDDLLYIPLSNKFSIAHIYTIQSMNNKLFIGVSPQQIISFDIQGNFLNNVGKTGRGPGEYQYAFLFALDKENKQVFVLNKDKILVYSEKGEFKREIDISNYEGNFDAIGYKGGYISF